MNCVIAIKKIAAGLRGHPGRPGGGVGVVEGRGAASPEEDLGPAGRDQHRGGEGDLGHLEEAAVPAEAGRRVAQREALAASSQRDLLCRGGEPGGGGAIWWRRRRRSRSARACATSAARPGPRSTRTPRPPTGASTPAGTSGTAMTPRARSPGRSGSPPSWGRGSSRSSARSVTPPTAKPARKAAGSPSKRSRPMR